MGPPATQEFAKAGDVELQPRGFNEQRGHGPAKVRFEEAKQKSRQETEKGMRWSRRR